MKAVIKHELILLEELPDHLSICDFPRSEMTIISDDFILKHHVPIRQVRMYWEYYGNVNDGINYYGTTILNNDMALELKNKLIEFCDRSDDLSKFTQLLEQAVEEKKFVVHFGV